jgi:hypothetical protein
MSIRIVNKTNGRTIIIKNQNDMNHLDSSVSSIDDDDNAFRLMPRNTDTDDADKNDPYSEPSSYHTMGQSTDLINNMRYKKSGFSNAMFDVNSFDDDKSKHYIKTTEYPLADEIKSWFNPMTVDAPITRLKTTDIPDDQISDTQQTSDLFGQSDGDDNNELSDDTKQSDTENTDFQGLIRTIRGACLVFKRKSQNGTFDELWIYNVGDNLKQETIVRKAILAGTDIDPNTQMSDDGTQKAKTHTIGNIQFLNISGLVQ